MEWEITPDDIEEVLNAHGIEATEDLVAEAFKKLNHGAILNGLMYYTLMEHQTQSMLHDIEKQLREAGMIPAEAEELFGDPETDYSDYGEGDLEFEEG